MGRKRNKRRQNARQVENKVASSSGPDNPIAADFTITLDLKKWRAEELKELNARPLVYLSACHTALPQDFRVSAPGGEAVELVHFSGHSTLADATPQAESAAGTMTSDKLEAEQLYAFERISFAQYLRMYWRILRAKPAVTESRPVHPASAEYLLYLFLSQKDREGLLGDLAEEFDLVVQRFGARKARLWYWVQVLRSLGPLLTTAAGTVAKWGVLGYLANLIRRMAG